MAPLNGAERLMTVSRGGRAGIGKEEEDESKLAEAIVEDWLRSGVNSGSLSRRRSEHLFLLEPELKN